MAIPDVSPRTRELMNRAGQMAGNPDVFMNLIDEAIGYVLDAEDDIPRELSTFTGDDEAEEERLDELASAATDIAIVAAVAEIVGRTPEQVQAFLQETSS